MATDNAKHAFDEKRRAADDIDERLLRVQERLRLPTLPRRIECCDISHFGGGARLGSARPVYRRFGEGKRKRARRQADRSRLLARSKEPDPAAAEQSGAIFAGARA